MADLIYFFNLLMKNILIQVKYVDNHLMNSNKNLEVNLNSKIFYYIYNS